MCVRDLWMRLHWAMGLVFKTTQRNKDGLWESRVGDAIAQPLSRGAAGRGHPPGALGGVGMGGRGKAVPLGRPVVISVPVCYPPTECFSLLCLTAVMCNFSK